MTHLAPTLSANAHLKARFGDVVSLSLIAAAVAHLLVFQLSPEIAVPDWGSPDTPETTIIDMPDIGLPAPPPPITRPALPVISANVDPTATVPVVDFQRAADLPAPPSRVIDAAAGDRSPFVVYEVAPRLTNPDDVQRALTRAYPAVLRNGGIGGTVTLEIFVGDDGLVVDGNVAEGSGYGSLDEAALSLIEVMRFSPALNRDRSVAVWVQIPIEFRARQTP